MGQVIPMFGKECDTPADEHDQVLSTEGDGLLNDRLADALWGIKGAVDDVFDTDTPEELSNALAEVKRLAKQLPERQ